MLPDGLDLSPKVPLHPVRWNGAPEPPPPQPVLATTEIFVLPYMGLAENAALAASMPRLRVVQALTAGVDGIAERLPAGVILCNAVGVHDASTAELALGLMIAAQRGLDDAARDTVEGRWDHRTRRTLADSRVLVVGWGGVGRAIGARLAPFEVDVVPVARSARPGVRGIEELDGLLPSADIVVLAVPLTTATRGLLDARRLALLSSDALVVNMARGPVIDTDALVAELSTGRLRAALDVTDPEPLPADHPLWRAPGVLITPHIGGDTTAFPPRAQELLTAQVRRYCAGEPLVGVVAIT